MRTRKNSLQITVGIRGGKVVRLDLKERTSAGEYQRLDRPWGATDLACFKKVARALTLVSSGISDVQEVLKTVNARRSRRTKSATTPTPNALTEAAQKRRSA
jgi:hypothetical protein